MAIRFDAGASTAPDTHAVFPRTPGHECRAAATPPSGNRGRLRILLVGEACTIAHVARPAVLARWARQADHQVFFACGAEYAHVARMEGLDILPVPSIPTSRMKSRIDQGRFFYAEAELEEYLRAELELYERVVPDLVVGDWRLSLGISAAVAGIPMLSLLNAHWSPHGSCRLPPPDGGFFRHLPHALRTLAMECIRPFGFRLFATPVFNRLRRRYGLPALMDFRQHYAAGTYCAYLDHPEFHPLPELPESHFFLGPIPWQPRGLPDFPLGAVDRSRPLVYVTLGGTGDAGSLLSPILGALANLDCTIALSGVEEQFAERAAAGFPSLAGRIRTARLADPEPLLRRASLTICHGGSGTVYQSLAAGVPLLCLPSNPDQGMVSEDCARAGAGLKLESWRATSGRLERAVRTLLKDGRCKERAQGWAAALRAHDTRARWQEWLQSAVPKARGKPSGSEAGRNA